MGQIVKHFFTKEQLKFLDALRGYPDFLQQFYLTGGTALSACYLDHRLSEDIDLFSRRQLDEQRLLSIMASVIKKFHASSTHARVQDRITYEISIPHQKPLKIDYVFYDFDQLENPNSINGLQVDSFTDIAVNKLLSISQRCAAKDYVDLYFILKKYTFWDLMHGVEHKFKIELEPLYLSSLLYRITEIDALPIIKKKLSLEQLQEFFKNQAVTLASKFVKE